MSTRILKRPHFRIQGTDLYFLISTRPYLSLTDEELSFWNALSDETTIDFPLNPMIQKFLSLGIIDLAEAEPEIERKKILVIEPHSDDAILSVGGTMWLQRRSNEFIIVTLASESNFTSYYELDRDFFKISEITHLRYLEGKHIAGILNGQYLTVGLDDVAIRHHRFDWTLAWFRKHRMSILTSIGRFYTDKELHEWTSKIKKLLIEVQCEEIWIPIGVGPHCDHQLTRDACLTAITEDPSLVAGKTLKFYQEVPYASRHKHYSTELVNALTDAGVSIKEETVEVESVFKEKLHLITLYGSQFKLKNLLPEITDSAINASKTGEKAELFWKIDQLPMKIDLSKFQYNASLIDKIKLKLSNWFQPHQKVKRLRVLLLCPTGRWDNDVDTLLTTFPNAQIEVYASPAAAIEVQENERQRVHLYPVNSGMISWITLSLKIAFSKPIPTLFVTGEKRFRECRLIACLWPMSRPIVVSFFDHLKFLG